MNNAFFDHPILNSPYACPGQHWELDQEGQPTQRIEAFRRPAKFVTPIPKPKRRKGVQKDLILDEGHDHPKRGNHR